MLELAVFYMYHDSFEEAETLCTKALEEPRRSPGLDHEITQAAFHNLVIIYEREAC